MTSYLKHASDIPDENEKSTSQVVCKGQTIYPQRFNYMHLVTDTESRIVVIEHFLVNMKTKLGINRSLMWGPSYNSVAAMDWAVVLNSCSGSLTSTVPGLTDSKHGRLSCKKVVIRIAALDCGIKFTCFCID